MYVNKYKFPPTNMVNYMILNVLHLENEQKWRKRRCYLFKRGCIQGHIDMYSKVAILCNTAVMNTVIYACANPIESIIPDISNSMDDFDLSVWVHGILLEGGMLIIEEDMLVKEAGDI